MTHASSPQPLPRLESFVDAEYVDALIRHARLEDLGPNGVDVTSLLMIPETLTGEAVLSARQPGRLAGLALLPRIAAIYDERIKVHGHRADGHAAVPGEPLANITGPLRSILAMERVALNFITHLSGIATLTSQYVEKIEGLRARICDTRKTLPGLRHLEKYAVACGGGTTHRMGLYDAMLIKDNHLAHLPPAELDEALSDVVREARQQFAQLKFIEVEVDTVEQLEQVIDTGIDIVLLDNMNTDQLRQAVRLRDRLAPTVELEASGCVNLNSVEAIARTGVDRISVGALTHSAPSLDVGLDIG